MASVNDIRRTFLDFFKKNGHAVVPSSPLVPRNDPTLMFTNAGMVQFKNVFTGQETRPYVRAASSQKCVRAGGKHNDLDNVGYTSRHHTFFEMLGNFSFGDYFKEQAIPLAWDLLTKEYGLDRKRLTITVYHTDDEAYRIWKKLTGFGDDKIIRIASSDNFWQMGDTGPCGPCSEVFFDHGDKIFGGPPGSKDADGDRFVEIWNLVFMQFEQLPGGERVDLPKHSVDTGMGLERVAAVLQGVHDNYDIDLFKALIAASVQATGIAATGEHKASHRVIADHLRATSFLIADGVLPSNEGRGYVLRRIMRRAMRHAHLLGAEEPLMYRLVPSLVHEMGDTYHELQRAQPLITETLHLEETRFRKTLAKGLGLLGDATAKLKKGDVLPGETAFKLYDTYGFPLDLTEDALRARGVAVDTKGFDAAMERQKAEARKAWKGSGEAATESVWFEVKEKTGATEFIGYDTETLSAEIVTLVKDGKETKALKAGDEAAIVVNQTPFYGESGGQVGDTGVIRGAKGELFRVADTQKKAGGLFVHFGKVEKGGFKPGDAVDLEVDHAARSSIRANHSATHLLHEALRQVLGDHVAQRGSLVAPDRLRFDFVHTKPMTPEEIAKVEDIANAVIVENAPVETRLMGVEEAKQSGARALFGEKYGDEVRVVSMGAAPGANTLGWSVELCGGTHVKRTGDIGLVKVLAEGASASGVRRIEALTGDAARAYLSEQETRLKEIASALHVRPEDAAERVKALIEERKQLERQLAEAKKQIAMGGGGKDAGPAIVEVGGRKFLKLSVTGVEMKDLKAMADDGRAKIGSGIVAIANNSVDGKLGIVVAVTTDLTGEVSAVDLVRAGSEAVGGKGGGGRPDMAQAGGPDGSRADAALQAIEDRLNAA
ncbi:alanine--tRNA ligase [Hyphomicrobium sp. xq]|uniref:Alanine--tRNA ligase n=1 Tax=Hyphomicrobium album TaxID=2665159 RepID=A0A6I3KKR6_9HYPH|nr:alanine--tRNA ligase [Hyphomicrobium album]MTD93321.1 alanine--tRNA ligase [Hyphomicrobium album]